MAEGLGFKVFKPPRCECDTGATLDVWESDGSGLHWTAYERSLLCVGRGAP